MQLSMLRQVAPPAHTFSSLFNLLHLKVAANELSAVDAVLSADEQRTKLIAEEKRLTKLVEKGDTSDVTQKALEQVYVDLQSIGADAADSRARRILSVRFLPARPMSCACCLSFIFGVCFFVRRNPG
jgi:hypothetical protein